MAEENNQAKADEKEKQTYPFFDLSRKVMLASVGAAVLAQEEVSRFIDHLVERGEIAEKDAKRLVKEVLDRGEKQVRERQEEFHRTKSNKVDRSEIEALTQRVNELSRKLDELKSKSGE